MNLLKCYLKQSLIFVLVSVVIAILCVLLSKIAVAPIPIREALADELSIDNQNVEVIRDDIDRLIDQLAYCESRNNENAINPRDPVTASLGLLQFKVDTFWHYNEIYKILPDLERHEIDNIIFDGATQRKLAKEILKDGHWKNWYNCLKPYFL